MNKNNLDIFSFLLRSPPLCNRETYDNEHGFTDRIYNHLKNHSFVIHDNKSQFIRSRDMEIKWFMLISVAHGGWSRNSNILLINNDQL